MPWVMSGDLESATVTSVKRREFPEMSRQTLFLQ
jgi:hypothetical protein